MDYRIFPPDELIETTVKLPLSKSMANRVLTIAALAGAPTPEALTEICDDTRAMGRALTDPDAKLIDVGAAGTAMRFLTAVMAASAGREVTIDGSERMRCRPIGPLVDALRSCGALIDYVEQEGFPPLHITGQRLKGGDVTVDAGVSSQFVSALLMAGPMMTEGLTLTLKGTPVSEPYIAMTLAMMRRAGADAAVIAPGVIRVEPGGYPRPELRVEADWSAAAFWMEIQSLSSGFITLDHLSADSVQGDSAAARIFADLGVMTDFEGEEGLTELTASPDLSPRLLLDMTDTPDLVLPVAVTCCLLRVPFRFTGLRTLRIKETDRIEALCREMLKLGVELTVEGDDVMWWEGRCHPISELPEFDTYDDHRMAMALAPVALFLPGIVVRNAEVTSKSYPDFWAHLEQAGFRLTDGNEPYDPAAEEGME